MKDWSNVEADIDLIMQKHFTAGRNGRKIDKIVLHHNAGNLTVRGCYDVWQNREASAHYQVQSDGVIGQLVWDRDTAWHAGDYEANLTSIGIEHADISSSPWALSKECIDAGAHLVAALCHLYKLGRPTWGVNVFGHSHFSATDCPASIAGSQNAEYMSIAQAYYDNGSAPAASAPAQPAQSVDIDALARAVIRGDYGNGDERQRRLGSNYAAVQARVNQILQGR